MLKRYLIPLILLYSLAFSGALKPIEFGEWTKDLSILQDSYYIFVDKNISVDEVVKKKFTKKFGVDYKNFGYVDKKLWVKFTLKNSSPTKVEKMLVITNPNIPAIRLYQIKDNTPTLIEQKRETLPPSYKLIFEPNQTATFYFKVDFIVSTKLGLYIKDIDSFIKEDKRLQIIDALLVGIVVSMLFYNLILFLFVRNMSYLFYSIYLIAFIIYASNFVGLIQVYFGEKPASLILNNLIILLNIGLGSYALFVANFTDKAGKSKYFRWIIYVEIAILLILTTLLSSQKATDLKIDVLLLAFTLLTLYIYNIVAYIEGNIEFRFIIFGFLIVLFGYLITILDSLGVIHIIHNMQNIMLLSTALEVILLSVAFVDKYMLLSKKRLESEKLLLKESQDRESLVTQEVIEKTDDLNEALKRQKLLFDELHHRVKNNLQLILSIIRLQEDHISDKSIKNEFESLENRISTIATTHNTIYLSKQLESVDMNRYIKKIISGFKVMDMSGKVEFIYDIDMYINLKDAISIGLIINEVVTNSLKYAFDDEQVDKVIKIILKDNLLFISDNGKGFDYEEQKEKSLGLKLVEIIARDQLKADLEIETKNGTIYQIRLKDG